MGNPDFQFQHFPSDFSCYPDSNSFMTNSAGFAANSALLALPTPPGEGRDEALTANVQCKTEPQHSPVEQQQQHSPTGQQHHQQQQQQQTWTPLTPPSSNTITGFWKDCCCCCNVTHSGARFSKFVFDSRLSNEKTILDTKTLEVESGESQPRCLVKLTCEMKC